MEGGKSCSSVRGGIDCSLRWSEVLYNTCNAQQRAFDIIRQAMAFLDDHRSKQPFTTCTRECIKAHYTSFSKDGSLHSSVECPLPGPGTASGCSDEVRGGSTTSTCVVRLFCKYFLLDSVDLLIVSSFQVRLERVPTATDDANDLDISSVETFLACLTFPPPIFGHRPGHSSPGADEFIVCFPLSVDFPDLPDYEARLTVQKIFNMPRPIANPRRPITARSVLHGSGHNKNYGKLRFEDQLIKADKDMLEASPDVFQPNGKNAVYMVSTQPIGVLHE